AAATAAVALLSTESEPAAFVAVTTAVITAPSCSDASTSVVAVLPSSATPSAYHWRVYVTAGTPAQVPFETVSVWPTVAVPVMAGATEFVGATCTGEIFSVPPSFHSWPDPAGAEVGRPVKFTVPPNTEVSPPS